MKTRTAEQEVAEAMFALNRALLRLAERQNPYDTMAIERITVARDIVWEARCNLTPSLRTN